MTKPADHPIIYRGKKEPRDKNSFLWLHRDSNNKKLFEEYNGSDWESVIQFENQFLSLERVRPYLYRITFDSIPDDTADLEVAVMGCSSYVKDGKLYRNLDFNYDEAASFIVKTKDFEGMSFITGLNDGKLDISRLRQLPYRVCDGVNNYGIKVSTHVLYNDWQWFGSGNRSIVLTKLPYLVLTKVKSMETISDDLSGVLENLTSVAGLDRLGYLIQVLVTDGETTYVIMPPLERDMPYVLQNITAHPKLANFRWVNKEIITRQELQFRPTGVERYNMMPCPLEELRFTKAYEQPNRLSEFIGLRGTTKDSSDSELLAIYEDAREGYLNRQRDGRTWHTMHSVVYGAQMEELYIQENWKDNTLSEGVTVALAEHGTTEYWNSKVGYIPKPGAVIVYDDYSTVTKEGSIVNVPGVKIGTGNSFVQDLAFVSEDVRDSIFEHINNTDVHISQSERLRWDSKLSINDAQEVINEVLIFNR